MGPKTTPFFKRPLVWTFASAVALTKPRMGQCTALLIPASNGLKLSSAQSWKVTPRRWNAHFHTSFAYLWWCPILSECRHWLNFAFGICSCITYSLIWSDFLFCSCKLLWLKSASHWKWRWSALLICIISRYERLQKMPKPRSLMCWATWQSLHEYVSGCHPPQCHPMSRHASLPCPLLVEVQDHESCSYLLS